MFTRFFQNCGPYCFLFLRDTYLSVLIVFIFGLFSSERSFKSLYGKPAVELGTQLLQSFKLENFSCFGMKISIFGNICCFGVMHYPCPQLSLGFSYSNISDSDSPKNKLLVFCLDRQRNLRSYWFLSTLCLSFIGDQGLKDCPK